MLRFTRIRSWQRLSSPLNFANSLLQSTSLRASTSASGTRLLSHTLSFLIILSYLQEQEPQPQEPVSYPIYYLILSFYLLKFTDQLSSDHPPLTSIITSDSSLKSFAFREQCQDFAQVRMPRHIIMIDNVDQDCEKPGPRFAKRLTRHFFRPCWITLGAATS